MRWRCESSITRIMSRSCLFHHALHVSFIARDSGATNYSRKPFNSRSLYTPGWISLIIHWSVPNSGNCVSLMRDRPGWDEFVRHAMHGWPPFKTNSFFLLLPKCHRVSSITTNFVLFFRAFPGVSPGVWVRGLSYRNWAVNWANLW